MTFNVTVTVLEGDDEYTAASENADDLSLFKQNVSMRRSYKTHPRKRKEVLTNYRFNAIVARADGSEFMIKYTSPALIELAVISENTPFTIVATAVYKKATDSVQITRMILVFALDVYADPCEDSTYTEQLTRAIACFRTLEAVTSVTFGKEFKPAIKVALASDDPYNKAMLERNKNTERMARCVKVAEKRLRDFNILEKLKQ